MLPMINIPLRDSGDDGWLAPFQGKHADEAAPNDCRKAYTHIFVPTWVMMFENIHRLPGIYMSGVLVSLARCGTCTEVSLWDPVSPTGNQTWPKSEIRSLD